MFPFKEIVSVLFSVTEDVKIKIAGPADIGGWSGCILEDGSICTVKNAVEGKVGHSRTHKPEIVEMPEFHGWRITPHNYPPFEVGAIDIHRCTTGYECNIAKLCEMLFEKRDEALENAKHGSKERDIEAGSDV